MSNDENDQVESLANLPPLVPLALAFLGGLPMLPAILASVTVAVAMRVVIRVRGTWLILLPPVDHD